MSPGEMTWDSQSIMVQHLLYVLENWYRREGSYECYCFKLQDFKQKFVWLWDTKLSK